MLAIATSEGVLATLRTSDLGVVTSCTLAEPLVDVEYLASRDLACTTKSGKLLVVNPASGATVSELSGVDAYCMIAVHPTKPRIAASFAHDGRFGVKSLLLPGFKDEITTITPAPITKVAFSPSGDYLAAGDEDGDIRVWWGQ